MDYSKLRVEWNCRSIGEEFTAKELVRPGWETLPEAWCTTYQEFYDRVVTGIEALDRMELVGYNGAELVAVAILVITDDIHVGPCVTVMWNFVKPGHRGKLGRAAIRCAKALAQQHKVPMYCFTHRKGEGEYIKVYRRVHGR